MDSKTFIWHAKRGHGECIIELMKGDINKHKNDVKKILLNNFAFLTTDEYRSSYAYELAKFYDDSIYFVHPIWKKILRTNLNDNFTLEYLFDNLYFFLKNDNSLKFEQKIENYFIKLMNKENYETNESSSICSLISLILDLKINIKIIDIINDYYLRFSESTLDVSYIEYNYNIIFSRPKKNLNKININEINNFSILMEYICNQKLFWKRLPLISNYINNMNILKLLELIERGGIENGLITNILMVIKFSNKLSVKIIKKLIFLLNNLDVKQKRLIYEILNSKRTKNFSFLFKNEKFDNYFNIIINLNNYEEIYYDKLHKKIPSIKIDYNNTMMWYEIEECLINHFKSKMIDFRLVYELKFYLKNGLCSKSRFEIVKILIKNNWLSYEEIQSLRYDSNIEIRTLLSKKKKI